MAEGIYRCYTPKVFRDRDEALVQEADAILIEYRKAGYCMNLRMLHYQFVSRNLYENTQENYNKLGDIVTAGRLAGRLPWDAVEDLTRRVKEQATFNSPLDIVKAARETFKLDLWCTQPSRVEVWFEKDALTSVIAPICERLRVPYLSCRGYSSTTASWLAGQRFQGYVANGQRPVVLYLGDHDPSGLDMTRDHRDRLKLFTGIPVEVIRVALNMSQVTDLKLPPNYAKLSDGRAKAYVKDYGYDSWELDAVPPPELEKMVSRAVLAFRDDKLWDEAEEAEAHDMDKLDQIIEGMET